MTARSGDVRLRELAPGDGPALARLFDASPDTGVVRFRPVFRIDPYQAMTYDGDEVGVVAERPGIDGLAGLGMIRFGEAVVRGTRRPYALLHSLVVHPDARRQGLARAIIAWRLERIEARLGGEAVIAATIQKRNAGSFAGASRWATQFIGPINGTAVGLRSTAPKVPSGVSIRHATATDYEAYVAGYVRYHEPFDLWPALDPERLAGWKGRSPVPGESMSELSVAVDNRGNLLAGLGTTEVRRVSIVHVDAMPLVMRAINAVIHVVPGDGPMEQVGVGWMWFLPGATAAARALFETARWEARSRGNVLLVSFDRRSPLRQMVNAPVWLPQTQFNLAIRSREPIRPDRLIESVQG